MRLDPLRDPEPLIRRVYSYVAYRIGDGPEAEDVVSTTFEKALRYRDTYDTKRGEPIAWLLGIAKRCLNDALAARANGAATNELPDFAAAGDLEEDAVRRLTMQRALERLGDKDRELIALRYGADLSARAIAKLVGARTNAVEVALHRALARLRVELEEPEALLQLRPVLDPAAERV
jgi:RNA polymerase sigma factor (sigma-70 family)